MIFRSSGGKPPRGLLLQPGTRVSEARATRVRSTHSKTSGRAENPRTRLHFPPDRVGAPTSGLHRRPSRAPTLDYRQRGWTATLPQHPYRPRRKLRTLARAVVLHRKPGKGPDQDCRVHTVLSSPSRAAVGGVDSADFFEPPNASLPGLASLRAQVFY